MAVAPALTATFAAIPDAPRMGHDGRATSFTRHIAYDPHVLPLRAMIDARPTAKGWLAWWRGRTTLDRIGPGLWMGGFPRPDGVVLRAISEMGIQHVVTTTFERPHRPASVTTRWVPFVDLDLPLNMEPLYRAGREVAERIRSGQQVYVHCGHGYDRSGLVIALSLRELHPALTGTEILGLIRAGRGSEALHNRRFARYIRGLVPLQVEQEQQAAKAAAARQFMAPAGAQMEPARPL